MKKIIFILILFSIFNTYSQINLSGDAKYILTVDGEIGDSTGDRCCCGGLGYLYLYRQNGSKITLKPDDDDFWEYKSFSFYEEYTKVNPINTFKLYTRRRARSGGCKITQRKNYEGSIGYCQNINYVGYEGGGIFAYKVRGNMRFESKTSTSIEEPNEPLYLSSEEYLSINLPNNLEDRDFIWKYKIGNGIDNTIRNSKNYTNHLYIKGGDFLHSSAFGETISLWVESTCDNVSNVVTFTYLKSAPNISFVKPKNTRCFDSEDGAVKITFERPLDIGEVLSITINDLNNQVDIVDGIPIFKTIVSIVGIETLKNDNSFTFNEDIGKGLVEGDFMVMLFGDYNGTPLFIGGDKHTKNFSINKLSPVKFSSEITPVRCFDGNDGELTIIVEGGTSNYEYLLQSQKVGAEIVDWIPLDAQLFSGGGGAKKGIITGISSANYSLQIRDSNGCIAKEIVEDQYGEDQLGDIITKEFLIDIPKEPLKIVFTPTEPTGFGFSDGQILAHVTGGTSFNNTYASFVWKHENGTVWADVSTATYSANEGWFLTLNNAITGTYFLTVKDVNYNDAIDKDGCTIVNEEFTLNQPPALSLSLEETNTISCNNTNTFNNPSSDGELTATATGGVPLGAFDNNGLLYYYTWKKKDIHGNYQVLSGENSPILSNIDAGEYAVNIKDANGIVIGDYANNYLTSAIDITYSLKQPELLEISLNKVDVFCYQGDDASINATIIGGTGKYTYEWSNGAITEDIDTLAAGTYTIYVTDIKGCQAQASITINEPETSLEINYTSFFSPTFTGATNGWIEATITGGTFLDTGAYNYTWKDASGTSLNTQVTEIVNATSYVITLKNLGKGVYNLTIQDKNYSLAINKTNCTIVNSDYELFEPAPLTATITLQQPISCNSANTYQDPFGDGVLEVFAEGGVRLQPSENNGLSYYYTWKKETNPGVWVILTSQTTNTAYNLDAGTYAVNIEDANGIIIGVYENNILVNAMDVPFLFEEPTLLKLDIEKQDVYCFNGSDAWAKANITGGTPPYTVLWSNGDTTEQTSNLSQGVYELTVSDSRGCHVTGSIQINQPTAPLSINYTAFATPSTGGASDGWIAVEITGGTAVDNGSYTYYWQDANGAILNTQTTTSTENDVYEIRLNDIPKGNYFLTIEDANFPLASTGDGCTIIDNDFILYDPIEATISEHTPISCHGDNSFNNPFADGALQVVVTGGLPFSEGQEYIYYWKKENEIGEFDALNQNSSTAINLSDGNYALNVADSRGVVIGVYESLNLINPTDAIFYFLEPELLEVLVSTTEISCDTGNNATATVAITGGIPPYKIQWSNGQNTATASKLIAGNYVVFISDARGCQVTGDITIEQPGGIQITVLKEKHPTCFQGNDGAINLAMSGGVPPYEIAWDTGETSTNISNLSQGTYLFSLIDANGCKAFKEIRLVHPTKITINLGSDRTLCKDQTHEVDGSIADENATYSWNSDNGFSATTPSITISKAGTYQVMATSTLGCTATDSIVISYNDTVIDSEFLLSSQAYVNQEVILFNVSSPMGATFEWVIPKEVDFIEKSDLSITLRFPKVATYELGLISTQGECYEEQYKNIVIEKSSDLPSPGDTNNPFIEEFMLSPNPNNGQFELYIKLAESSQIAVRVFSIQGSFIFAQPIQASAEEYKMPMSLNLSTGTYFVVLETAKETRIKRMIIM